MIYFYCTSWQFFQMIVKWRISPTTEQIMFTFSILLFHFYSHIPYGMWRIPKLKHFVLLRFLLTHPVWDVTMRWIQRYSRCLQFLLTHPVWDVTIDSRKEVIPLEISTHTSRVGCDNICIFFFPVCYISTHTSRVGCDGTSSGATNGNFLFLLTHPVWDVTN